MGTEFGVEIPLVPISRNTRCETDTYTKSENVHSTCETADAATNTYDFKTNLEMTSNAAPPDETIVMLKNNRVTEWLLRCSIGGVRLGAVIDSGAVMSTMNYKTYQSISSHLTLTPTDQRIRGVGGHAFHVHGIVNTKLVIANHEYAIKFVILDSPENIQLGADFLSDYNVQVDLGNATARIVRVHSDAVRPL